MQERQRDHEHDPNVVMYGKDRVRYRLTRNWPYIDVVHPTGAGEATEQKTGPEMSVSNSGNSYANHLISSTLQKTIVFLRKLPRNV